MDSINEARRSTAQYFLEGLTEIGCDYIWEKELGGRRGRQMPPDESPNIALRNQAWIWSGGFIVFGLSCAYAAWKSSDPKAPPGTGPSVTVPSVRPDASTSW